MYEELLSVVASCRKEREGREQAEEKHLELGPSLAQVMLVADDVLSIEGLRREGKW